MPSGTLHDVLTSYFRDTICFLDKADETSRENAIKSFKSSAIFAAWNAAGLEHLSSYVYLVIGSLYQTRGHSGPGNAAITQHELWDWLSLGSRAEPRAVTLHRSPPLPAKGLNPLMLEGSLRSAPGCHQEIAAKPYLPRGLRPTELYEPSSIYATTGVLLVGLMAMLHIKVNQKSTQEICGASNRQMDSKSSTFAEDVLPVTEALCSNDSKGSTSGDCWDNIDVCDPDVKPWVGTAVIISSPSRNGHTLPRTLIAGDLSNALQVADQSLDLVSSGVKSKMVAAQSPHLRPAGLIVTGTHISPRIRPCELDRDASASPMRGSKEGPGLRPSVQNFLMQGECNLAVPDPVRGGTGLVVGMARTAAATELQVAQKLHLQKEDELWVEHAVQRALAAIKNCSALPRPPRHLSSRESDRDAFGASSLFRAELVRLDNMLSRSSVLVPHILTEKSQPSRPPTHGVQDRPSGKENAQEIMRGISPADTTAKKSTRKRGREVKAEQDLPATRPKRQPQIAFGRRVDKSLAKQKKERAGPSSRAHAPAHLEDIGHVPDFFHADPETQMAEPPSPLHSAVGGRQVVARGEVVPGQACGLAQYEQACRHLDSLVWTAADIGKALGDEVPNQVLPEGVQEAAEPAVQKHTPEQPLEMQVGDEDSLYFASELAQKLGASPSSQERVQAASAKASPCQESKSSGPRTPPSPDRRCFLGQASPQPTVNSLHKSPLNNFLDKISFGDSPRLSEPKLLSPTPDSLYSDSPSVANGMVGQAHGGKAMQPPESVFSQKGRSQSPDTSPGRNPSQHSDKPDWEVVDDIPPAPDDDTSPAHCAVKCMPISSAMAHREDGRSSNSSCAADFLYPEAGSPSPLKLSPDSCIACEHADKPVATFETSGTASLSMSALSPSSKEMQCSSGTSPTLPSHATALVAKSGWGPEAKPSTPLDQEPTENKPIDFTQSHISKDDSQESLFPSAPHLEQTSAQASETHSPSLVAVSQPHGCSSAGCQSSSSPGKGVPRPGTALCTGRVRVHPEPTSQSESCTASSASQTAGKSSTPRRRGPQPQMWQAEDIAPLSPPHLDDIHAWAHLFRSAARLRDRATACNSHTLQPQPHVPPLPAPERRGEEESMELLRSRSLVDNQTCCQATQTEATPWQNEKSSSIRFSASPRPHGISWAEPGRPAGVPQLERELTLDEGVQVDLQSPLPLVLRPSDPLVSKDGAGLDIVTGQNGWNSSIRESRFGMASPAVSLFRGRSLAHDKEVVTLETPSGQWQDLEGAVGIRTHRPESLDQAELADILREALLHTPGKPAHQLACTADKDNASSPVKSDVQTELPAQALSGHPVLGSACAAPTAGPPLTLPHSPSSLESFMRAERVSLASLDTAEPATRSEGVCRQHDMLYMSGTLFPFAEKVTTGCQTDLPIAALPDPHTQLIQAGHQESPASPHQGGVLPSTDRVPGTIGPSRTRPFTTWARCQAARCHVRRKHASQAMKGPRLTSGVPDRYRQHTTQGSLTHHDQSQPAEAAPSPVEEPEARPTVADPQSEVAHSKSPDALQGKLGASDEAAVPQPCTFSYPLISNAAFVYMPVPLWTYDNCAFPLLGIEYGSNPMFLQNQQWANAHVQASQALQPDRGACDIQLRTPGVQAPASTESFECALDISAHVPTCNAQTVEGSSFKEQHGLQGSSAQPRAQEGSRRGNLGIAQKLRNMWADVASRHPLTPDLPGSSKDALVPQSVTSEGHPVQDSMQAVDALQVHGKTSAKSQATASPHLQLNSIGARQECDGVNPAGLSSGESVSHPLQPDIEEVQTLSAEPQEPSQSQQTRLWSQTCRNLAKVELNQVSRCQTNESLQRPSCTSLALQSDGGPLHAPDSHMEPAYLLPCMENESLVPSPQACSPLGVPAASIAATKTHPDMGTWSLTDAPIQHERNSFDWITESDMHSGLGSCASLLSEGQESSSITGTDPHHEPHSPLFHATPTTTAMDSASNATTTPPANR
eukprot:jgi/Botrbrau1/9623/Bobra.0131s0003.1